MYSKVTLKVFFYRKYNGMITLLRKFGKFIQIWWQILCLTQAPWACFPLSLCLPRLLICARDGLVDWFLFWNNYQNFCSPACKSLLGREGEATGVSYSSRDTALALQGLRWALKPHVLTMDKCLIPLAVQPGWEHQSIGWGKDVAKGWFRWRWARGSTWVLLGVEQSRVLYHTSFVTCSSQALLLLSSAKGLEHLCTRKLS